MELDRKRTGLIAHEAILSGDKSVDDARRSDGRPALEVPAAAEDTVEEILQERPKVHGIFAVGARWTQACKRMAKTMPSWEAMADDQRESIDMIIHKTQRILAGDPNHADHWDDIAGYALLVSKRLKAEAAAKKAQA